MRVGRIAAQVWAARTGVSAHVWSASVGGVGKVACVCACVCACAWQRSKQVVCVVWIQFLPVV